MSNTFTKSNGWTGNYEIVKRFGLVLSNVRHEHFRLAQDMRVVGVWAAASDPNVDLVAANPIGWGLGDDTHDTQNPAENERNCLLTDGPKETINAVAPAPFDVYRTTEGIFATFKPEVGGRFSESLEITQDYQFGPYGKNPPHEPGGIVMAARLLPLVTFRCNPLPTTGSPPPPRIRYIRIDYRMNYALDVFVRDPQKVYPDAAPTSLNQAGIFRDREFGINAPATQSQLFLSGEKPLQYEVVGNSLVNGQPTPPTPGGVATWDNIHQWAKLPGSQLPVTPGTYYACHTHWRWGRHLGTAAFGSLPQFQGVGWSASQGGPLLDRRILNQSITFVITANTFPPVPPDTKWSPFRSHFMKRLPANVKKGADLVQWFSIEVFREPGEPADPSFSWEGTVFIHGIFFAHNENLPLSDRAKLLLTNFEDEFLQPMPKQQWERGS